MCERHSGDFCHLICCYRKYELTTCSPSTQPQISGDAIRFDSFDEARGQTLYWKLPAKFGGDKVTSYGGNLNFVYRCTGGDNNQANRSPDVILRVSLVFGTPRAY